VADFKIKAAISFPLFLLLLPAEGLGHPPSRRPQGPLMPGSLEAITVTLPVLSPKFAVPLDELETLGLVMGQAGLEEHRVHPELSVQEGHVTIHLDKKVDAFMSLMKVGVIM
jgi:hypothetical protein